MAACRIQSFALLGLGWALLVATPLVSEAAARTGDAPENREPPPIHADSIEDRRSELVASLRLLEKELATADPATAPWITSALAQRQTEIDQMNQALMTQETTEGPMRAARQLRQQARAAAKAGDPQQERELRALAAGRELESERAHANLAVEILEQRIEVFRWPRQASVLALRLHGLRYAPPELAERELSTHGLFVEYWLREERALAAEAERLIERLETSDAEKALSAFRLQRAESEARLRAWWARSDGVYQPRVPALPTGRYSLTHAQFEERLEGLVDICISAAPAPTRCADCGAALARWNEEWTHRSRRCASEHANPIRCLPRSLAACGQEPHPAYLLDREAVGPRFERRLQEARTCHRQQLDPAGEPRDTRLFQLTSADATLSLELEIEESLWLRAIDEGEARWSAATVDQGAPLRLIEGRLLRECSDVLHGMWGDLELSTWGATSGRLRLRVAQLQPSVGRRTHRGRRTATLELSDIVLVRPADGRQQEIEDALYEFVVPDSIHERLRTLEHRRRE